MKQSIGECVTNDHASYGFQQLSMMQPQYRCGRAHANEHESTAFAPSSHAHSAHLKRVDSLSCSEPTKATPPRCRRTKPLLQATSATRRRLLLVQGAGDVARHDKRTDTLPSYRLSQRTFRRSPQQTYNLLPNFLGLLDSIESRSCD